MPHGASPEAIAAARAYESLHVPSLFAEWARPVLHAARVEPGQHLVDVACGTGVLARAALEVVGSGGAVVGVDPDPGMLAVAAEVAPGVDLRSGTAEALPLEDRSVDGVVSQFGMMFFRDPALAVEEMLRVLRPGGRLAVAVWDRLDRSAAYSALVSLLDDLAGAQAADALRAPFALGEMQAFARPFEEAGVEDVKVSTRAGTARFPSLRAMVEADLRGWLPVMGVVLDEDLIRTILAEAELALAPYVGPDGRTAFPTSAHILSGARA